MWSQFWSCTKHWIKILKINVQSLYASLVVSWATPWMRHCIAVDRPTIDESLLKLRTVGDRSYCWFVLILLISWSKSEELLTTFFRAGATCWCRSWLSLCSTAFIPPGSSLWWPLIRSASTLTFFYRGNDSRMGDESPELSAKIRAWYFVQLVHETAVLYCAYYGYAKGHRSYMQWSVLGALCS